MKLASRNTSRRDRRTMKSNRSRRARLRSKNHCFHRCGKVCSSYPSVVYESLITMVDHGKNSGSYLYDLFRKQRKKLYKLTSDRNSIKCFYSERKAFKTQMGFTYKEINHTDNAVQKCNKSVHTRENSVTESQKY